MVRTLFDTCGFDRLFWPQHARVKGALDAAIEDGRIDTLITYPLIGEMAGLAEHDWPGYLDQVRTLVAWCKGKVLARKEERCNRELRLGRKLVGAEMLDRQADFVTLAGMLQDPLLVPGEAAITQSNRATLAESERKKKAAAHADFRELDPDFRPADVPFGDFDDDVISWATDDMRALALETYNVTLVGELRPRELPTFWFANALHVAKLRRVIPLPGDGGLGKKHPGAYDELHLTDAAYADVFVTADRRLLKLAADARLPARVMAFQDWRDTL